MKMGGGGGGGGGKLTIGQEKKLIHRSLLNFEK